MNRDKIETVSRARMTVLLACVCALTSSGSMSAASEPQACAWQRWEHVLTSTRNYVNPYAEVILRVMYTGPIGQTIPAYGFWDGGDTFRIRWAFPIPGAWRWETECSDAANAGLHKQQGTVEVSSYQGDGSLYRRGFLKVSENRRYLTYADGTPFLWVGDTAWSVPMRAIVARLFGNFVIFSPSFDSRPIPLADEVGQAASEATAVHLITQHPGTPSSELTPTFSLQYYDQPYLDIAGVQTGHNGGNRVRCAHRAIEWILHLYRHEPHKPIINLEAMYDARGENGWQAVDARGLAWRSWLSGAMGYTYGAGDVPPKVSPGSGAVWKWATDPQKYDYWEKALQWDSAFQMQHLHDFLAALDWWRLEPAHELIHNQPEDVMRRMVLAKSAAGDLAVAYLPGNETIEIDVSVFPQPLRARWFDPVKGVYEPVAGEVVNQGIRQFVPPRSDDWALHLTKGR